MRILLADGSSKVRFALRVLLEQHSDLIVVSEIDDAENLLSQIQVSYPDVVLLDWDLPNLDRQEFLQHLRQRNPHLKVVALSGDPDARQSSLEVGVDSFVAKSDPPDRLLSVIGWNEKRHKG